MTEISLKDRLTEKTVVSLGLFDGVHCGHRLITNAAEAYDYASAVFTFRTESVRTKHGKPLEYIYTNEQKLRLLNAEYVLSPDFDDIAGMSGEEFAERILCGVMNAGAAVCGENFRFGKGASCGAEELERFGRELGFEVKIVPLGENGFSSEKFRALLREGRVDRLCELNCGYRLYGEVVCGNRIGRDLGFPTVNQLFARGQLVPRFGVYAASAEIDGRLYPSVTNIGVKPTVAGERAPLAETHILGFSGDLYGRKIEVCLQKFIREERRFGSLAELKEQIFADIEAVSC